MSNTTPARRSTTIEGFAGVALIAIALTGIGCGSGDEEGGPDGQGNTAANGIRSEDYGVKTPDPDLRDGSDEDQVRYAVQALQSNFIVGNGNDYCSALTPTTRSQLADAARAYDHGTTCEDFINVTARLTRQVNPKQKPTVVRSVTVDDDRAAARVSDGGRPPETMTFLRQDGQWKYLDPNFKANLGLADQDQP